MNQLYDVNAAARQLAVSPWTIRSYIRQGKLRPVRIGRLVRLDEEELSKFVASNKTMDSGQEMNGDRPRNKPSRSRSTDMAARR